MRKSTVALIACGLHLCSFSVAGEWSRNAERAERPPAQRDQTIRCGKSKLVLKGALLRVETEGRALPLLRYRTHRQETIRVPPTVEFLWSPDCRAVAITSNEFGTVGGWDLRVVRLHRGVAHLVDLNAHVRAAMLRVGFCSGRQEPNIAAVAWGEASHVLHVVGEVPNHSSCREMGLIRGFDLDATTGKIQRSFPEAVIRKRWKSDLGDYLRRRADDVESLR